VGSTSSPQTVTVSAYGPVTISNAAVSANYSEADNCPASMANGTTCTMYAHFVPTASGSLNGNITVNSNGFFSQVNTVNLTGLGSAISLGGAPLAFGNETVKVKSAANSVTATNSGATAITMGAITSTNTTDYAIASNNCPASGATLAAKATCTVSGAFISAATTTCTPNLIIASGGNWVINVQFHPTVVGFAMGSISVSDNDATSPQSVSLQGYGTGVKFNPGSINFGTVTRGAQVSSTATITNVGTSPVFFIGAELTGTSSADFSVNYGNSPPCGNSQTNPLLPGKTCQITVYFLPSKVGAESATYKVFSNSVGSPQTLPLVGTGQ